MNILLDTNILLIWLADSPTNQSMIAVIESERNSIFFSPLSIWEVRIKAAKGRLELPAHFLTAVRSKDFTELRFTSEHADEAGTLPNIHADPFDRGLVAQARREKMSLLTTDDLLGRYDVRVLVV